MSVEIANVIDSMVSFVAGVTPTIISRTGNIANVTYIAVGRYRVSLVQKIPTGAFSAPGSQCRAAVNQSGAAAFAFAFEDALSVGDIEVNVRNLAGALADTGGRVDVEVLRYPTQA